MKIEYLRVSKSKLLEDSRIVEQQIILDICKFIL